jgi:hypothetical protein
VIVPEDAFDVVPEPVLDQQKGDTSDDPDTLPLGFGARVFQGDFTSSPSVVSCPSHPVADRELIDLIFGAQRA